MHTLLFLDPGHFHAALVLRTMNPRVSPDIHVYAQSGPDLSAFLAYVEAFNARPDSPCTWRVNVHTPGDPLEALIAERRGESVVLAGRNNTKLATIHRLQNNGFNVLADKPWLTNSEDLGVLDALHSGPPFVMDIMTERFDTIARLRKHLVDSALFGGFAPDALPAIHIGSTHHLLKRVNGAALRRPAWYFDVSVQGNGLVDIQSHMADQVQWLVAGDEPIDVAEDVELLRAKSTSTAVTAELYRECTGDDDFPAALMAGVDGSTGELALRCNGEIEYRFRGVSVRQTAHWGAREPDGGGDQHYSVVRGVGMDIAISQGPDTNFSPALRISAKRDAATRAALCEVLANGPASEWKLEGESGEFQLRVADAARTSHESNFARVLDLFLDTLDAQCAPPALLSRIKARYSLLGQAHREDAHGGSSV